MRAVMVGKYCGGGRSKVAATQGSLDASWNCGPRSWRIFVSENSQSPSANDWSDAPVVMAGASRGRYPRRHPLILPSGNADGNLRAVGVLLNLRLLPMMVDGLTTALPTHRATINSNTVLRTVPLGRLGSYQIHEHLAWPASSFIPPASGLARFVPDISVEITAAPYKVCLSKLEKCDS